MKRYLVLILLTIFLSSCGTFNLDYFVMPDDAEFLTIIQELNTPEKICNYMEDNFTFTFHEFYTPDPYTFWKLKEGDCNDFSTFAVFVANYHEYETYQIYIYFQTGNEFHAIAVYKEYGKYTYSSNKSYYPIYTNSFKKCVFHYFLYSDRKLKSYKVYDYENNLIEVGDFI